MSTNHLKAILKHSKDVEEDHTTRKLRFVCISDTHNAHDQICKYLVPGDVLVHTGDITKRGTMEEIASFNEFLGKIKSMYRYIVVIPGNHDLFLDPNRRDLSAYSEDFVRQNLLSNVTHYLVNQYVVIEGIKIFGSPCTPGGAFKQRDLNNVWKLIPDDTDVLLTHNPPLNILDLAWVPSMTSTEICQICNESHERYCHWGCGHLKQHVFERVRPKVHIFGHVHDAYGHKMINNIHFINTALKWNPMQKPHSFDYVISENAIKLVNTKYEFGKIYNVQSPQQDTRVFRILSKRAPNYALTANVNDSTVRAQPLSSSDYQKWIVSRDGYIQLKGYDLVIDIDRANRSSGASLILWKKLQSASNQQWHIQQLSSDSWLITSLMHGYALDFNTYKEHYGELIMYPVHKNDNQLWTFESCE